MRPRELRRDQIGVFVGRPGWQGFRENDAGEFDLELDRAVLVEIPEEAVVVVTQRRDRGYDKSTGSPDLGVFGLPVVVLPADTEVFLMDADCVSDRLGVPSGVSDYPIHVADLAETVAAEHQRVRGSAHAAFTRIKIVAPLEAVVRVPIRNNHLAEGGSIED